MLTVSFGSGSGSVTTGSETVLTVGFDSGSGYVTTGSETVLLRIAGTGLGLDLGLGLGQADNKKLDNAINHVNKIIFFIITPQWTSVHFSYGNFTHSILHIMYII
ncbi:hypothetical protein AGMMS49950_08420 [Endomicrobiia bacterium]|nr:hypothetical protein AGMMS49950_08420 [Endomicrobiia bacterium]